MEYQNSQYLDTFPGYLKNSVLRPRPFYYNDFHKGIERIVLDEPEKSETLADRVFSDKSKTLKSTIKALFNEIMLRERLDSFLLYSIDEDICKCRNYLNELRLLSNPYNPVSYLTGRRTRLEGHMFRLEEEKRKTYLECWKNLFELKKELLSGLKDYWLISKRKSALSLENDKHDRYRNPVQETETYSWQ